MDARFSSYLLYPTKSCIFIVVLRIDEHLSTYMGERKESFIERDVIEIRRM